MSGPPVRQPRRRLALSVLIAAGVLAVAAFPFRATWWGGWILAIAEAGVIGGLADWFAVTAIFRRPLGLPIPHTALIPANWELLAARVGTMVGDRVLTKSYVTSELARVDVGALLARAAERVSREDLEAFTTRIARWIADEIPPRAGSGVLARFRALLRSYAVAPLVADLVRLARQHGWDARAIGGLARIAAQALEVPSTRKVATELIDALLDRYREGSRGYPRLLLGFAFGLVDRDRVVDAIARGLADIADHPDHPVRRRLIDALAELPKRLERDPELAGRVEAVKLELIESTLVARLLDDALAELGRVVQVDLATPRPDLSVWIADRLERVRQALLTDADLRREIDRLVKTQVATVLDRHHAGLAGFIENGVRALGPEGAVNLIEDHAGDDLQYIRVNGTVVGGLAGGALYGVHLLIKLFWPEA
ncbi:MAG: DUF445 domain-containing protein [Candidatus Rokubacteria bacterium]|nr:DUF445 domain-containing protein [Candidatus Rokubacteria bacterium]